MNRKEILAVRLSLEEKQMIDTLKGPPYWINIPQYVRDTLKHLYTSKITKNTPTPVTAHPAFLCPYRKQMAAAIAKSKISVTKFLIAFLPPFSLF